MKHILIILTILVFTACNNHSKITKKIPIKEHTILAVLWQQNAAEYRALCYQAFNTARFQLERLVQSTTSGKPLAIITDLDETILDNSPYSAELIDTDSNYQKNTWNKWGKKESALLLPGAAAFLSEVEAMGVEVFYVSNRGNEQFTETLNNLKKYQLPNVDSSHIFLKTDTSSKKQRRAKITETHEVLMLLGDNLSDFDELFEDLPSLQRHQKVKSQQVHFGQKFIVFPNPLYGDWETDGLYDGKRYNEEQKRAVRNAKLRRSE